MIFNGLQIMKPDTPFSEEVNSEKSVEKRTKKPGKLRTPPMLADGSTIELAKRPRGRPLGSKNKAKPPVFITASSEHSPALHPHVLEIPGGHDIVDCLSRFSKQRKLGICVLTATGVVANITLRHPASPHESSAATSAAAIVFQGRFKILSISATFLPPPAMAAAWPAPVGVGISISLAGLHGQIVGGIVVGPLMAAGAVVVVAASFANPTFYKLPVEDEVSDSVSGSGGEENCDKQYQSHSAAPPAELCGMTIYRSLFSPEILFPGGARPPPPPPY